MAEKYFGHAPRELRAAAGCTVLTTDSTLEEVGEQFGTHKTNIHNWVIRCSEPGVGKKSKPSPDATCDDRTPSSTCTQQGAGPPYSFVSRYNTEHIHSAIGYDVCAR